jgi:hypothetical protein
MDPSVHIVDYTYNEYCLAICGFTFCGFKYLIVFKFDNSKLEFENINSNIEYFVVQ